MSPLPQMVDEERIADEPKAVNKELPYFCPGCGMRSADPGVCNGPAESPHEPIAFEHVDNADELEGDEPDADDSSEATTPPPPKPKPSSRRPRPSSRAKPKPKPKK